MSSFHRSADGTPVKRLKFNPFHVTSSSQLPADSAAKAGVNHVDSISKQGASEPVAPAPPKPRSTPPLKTLPRTSQFGGTKTKTPMPLTLSVVPLPASTTPPPALRSQFSTPIASPLFTTMSHFKDVIHARLEPVQSATVQPALEPMPSSPHAELEAIPQTAPKPALEEPTTPLPPLLGDDFFDDFSVSQVVDAATRAKEEPASSASKLAAIEADLQLHVSEFAHVKNALKVVPDILQLAQKQLEKLSAARAAAASGSDSDYDTDFDSYSAEEPASAEIVPTSEVFQAKRTPDVLQPAVKGTSMLDIIEIDSSSESELEHKGKKPRKD